MLKSKNSSTKSNFLQWNENEESVRAQSAKNSKLEMYEILKQSKNQESQKDQTNEKQQENSGFFSSLTETIVNNIQIKIKNVHVRYEDYFDSEVFYASKKSQILFIETNCIWNHFREIICLQCR